MIHNNSFRLLLSVITFLGLGLLFTTHFSNAQYGDQFVERMVEIDSFGYDENFDEDDLNTEDDILEDLQQEENELEAKALQREIESRDRAWRYQKYIDDQDNESYSRRLWTIIIVLGGGGLLYLFQRYKYNQGDRHWEKGLFPENFSNSRDHLMEAYLRLAAMMMRYDKNELSAKMRFVNSYFNRHFKNIDIDFQGILTQAYKHPIKLKSASTWLRKNLTLQERNQVLYFLAGLSVVDGTFDPSEKAIIIDLSKLLGLSQKELDSILSIYERYEWQNQQKQRAERSKVYSKSRHQQELENCSKILGVSTSADMIEIKKAYRSLVKVHHPDRFANQSEAQQKLANDRFLAIQSAYEYLEENR